MKKSFVFYKSFYDAINVLGEKSQLKLYKSIMRLNFNDYETVEDMERLCDEIETDLKQNRYVYGTFMSIKPQLLANYKRYSNGIKGAKYGSLGAEFGKLGGRPKNPPNENVNVNVNVNENSFEKEKKEKKKDIFFGFKCSNASYGGFVGYFLPNLLPSLFAFWSSSESFLLNSRV